MKKLFFSVLFSFVFIINSEAENTLTKITIAEYGEFPLYTSLYVAQEKGFFKEQGLEVNILPAGGDEKSFAALLSDDAQFGIGDPTFVAISGQRGKPGRVLAAILQGLPIWGLTKKENLKPITDLKQLADYSIATYPAPSTNYTLVKKMLQNAGLAINIKEIVYGSLIPAMKAGKVDIISEFEPNASVAENQGAKRIFCLNDYYPDFALTGLTVLPQYAEEHPEIIRKVLKALSLATAFIYSDLPGTVDVLTKRFPELSKEILLTSIAKVRDKEIFPKSLLISKKGWDEAINLRKEVGDLKITAPYEEYVLTKFAEELMQK